MPGRNGEPQRLPTGEEKVETILMTTEYPYGSDQFLTLIFHPGNWMGRWWLNSAAIYYSLPQVAEATTPRSMDATGEWS